MENYYFANRIFSYILLSREHTFKLFFEEEEYKLVKALPLETSQISTYNVRGDNILCEK